MSEASSEPAGESSGIEERTNRKTGDRVGRSRRWFFRLAAVLLSLAGVGLCEVALHAIGVGRDLSLVTRVPHECEILKYHVNSDADRSFCPGEGMAGPEPRRFDLPRPDGVYRIVVVGASTVQGFPYASELAFPRQLELLLNRQQSERRVEVLNLGVTGVSSSIVASLLEECFALEPDLVIVHAGHNEFYGIEGAASTIGRAPQLVREIATVARRSRIGQLVGDVLPSGIPSNQDPIESLPADLEIRRDSDVFSTAGRQYRQNIEKMVRAAQEAGVPIVLSTVASNHRAHSPVSGFVPQDVTGDAVAKWRAGFDEGRRLAAQGNWEAGLAGLEQARTISADSSLLQYRRGECLLALGRIDEADDAFSLAADLDGCRFRAPSSFGGIVRSVVADANSDKVLFADTESSVRAAIALAGESSGDADMPVFLEHVHYSLKGHGIVAESMGKLVLALICESQWNDAIGTQTDDFRAGLGAMEEDDLVALSFALELYGREPMSRSFDVDRHRQRLANLVAYRFPQISPDRRDSFAELSLEQMADDLPRYLADELEERGNYDELQSVLEAAVRRRPWSLSDCQRLLEMLQSVNQSDTSSETDVRALSTRWRMLGGPVNGP